MRSSAAILLLLCACASDPLKGDHLAWLTFLGAVPNELGGIYSVDGHPAPGGTMRVSPGKHVIEFSCPGYMYTDNAPQLKATFEAGKSYEMSCDGTKPSIRIKE
jgi:hypothetical protein